ncbi:DNA repair metallo-beta-lactamase-domain-containing protein [Mucor mucedo]|uniref:DNA repair metallo-beta-lactamase-domain-containing protein n=1 Tax=Mucor mucedo TaxID=29922 RepID=UPI002220B0B4|nr:DNA repair metallo-beta-lactamase-domain-containing protein [Mucor mucedo]KAI7877093.1 DNA repair metallo-beta-lactamase-domain-containing protein [Mucor mucedo]
MIENVVTEDYPIENDVHDLYQIENFKTILEEKGKEREDSVKLEDVTSSGVVQHNNESTVKAASGLSRILPSSWKSLFSSSSTVVTPLSQRSTNNALNPPISKQRPCPFYKRVRDTRFTVDAFNFGKISDCDGYFLTHYHSDHYGGLKSKWSHGPIYCSQVTANLVKQELGVDRRYVHPLPMNELYPIPGSNVTIALIDANHCPGSVLFLFIVKMPDGSQVRHLHTGDFRASPRMCLHPLIRQPDNPPINCLYLDTTYLNPQYAFPAQEECIHAVCELVKRELNPEKEIETKKASLLDNWIKKTPDPMNLLNPSSTPNKSRVLIVVGTYTIGKERVFFNIAKMLKCKIYASPKKAKILLCQEDEELKSMMTSNPMEAQVHVGFLRDIRGDIMSNYLRDHQTHFDSLIAFKPTGWTYKSSSSQTSDMKLAPLSHIILPPSDRTLHISPYYDRGNIKLFGVPYSEHSSFRELASFIASLKIFHIIPTVNINQLQSMKNYFDKWEEEKLSKRIEVVAYPSLNHW